MLDVEKANRNLEIRPEMEVFFDFKKDFDLKDLSPTSHAELSEKIKTDPAIARLFKEFSIKQSREYADPVVCDSNCQKIQYCETFTTLREQKGLCLGSDVVDKNYHIEFDVLSKFTNPWVERNLLYNERPDD